jgi:hypothetical protein
MRIFFGDESNQMGPERRHSLFGIYGRVLELDVTDKAPDNVRSCRRVTLRARSSFGGRSQILLLRHLDKKRYAIQTPKLNRDGNEIRGRSSGIIPRGFLRNNFKAFRKQTVRSDPRYDLAGVAH